MITTAGLQARYRDDIRFSLQRQSIILQRYERVLNRAKADMRQIFERENTAACERAVRVYDKALSSLREDLDRQLAATERRFKVIG